MTNDKTPPFDFTSRNDAPLHRDAPPDAAPGGPLHVEDRRCGPHAPESEDADVSINEGFWTCGAGFERLVIAIEPPQRPLELLETLGPSPFRRGEFPVIGFLATTYDKVTRYALEPD